VPRATARDEAPLPATLDALHREHAARLLALLVRELRDFDDAEEALQEAWLAAGRQWPAAGLPPNPAGWLLTVARRRALDARRRTATLARKLPLLIVDVDPARGEDGDERDESDEETGTVIPDERLRLIFTACHPAIARPAQLALTLRFAAGLSTPEVARLLLVSEPTMAARLTRAKRKIAQAGIPYRVPRDVDLPERLEQVLAVVYLLFTEGYAPAAGEQVARPAVCAEAIRLGRLLRELMPDEPETTALLALMVLAHARRDARADGDGALVPLAAQQRDRWRHDEVGEGLELAAAAARASGLGPGGRAAATPARADAGAPGRYTLQALIAALHAAAPSAAATDWAAIAALYARLEQVAPSPAVRVARAVAVGEADGPEAGLALLADAEAALPHGPQAPAARAELLARLGRDEEAGAAYGRAIERAANGAQRAHLTRRRAALRRS
jgi:RNA polymerase sigma-70 factor (ECF subfamily)